MKKLLVSMMLILGMLAFAAESAPSATVGYVKYDNVTTAGSDFNMIAYPVDAGYATVGAMDPTATYINTINKWNAATQSWSGTSYNSMFGMWAGDYAPEVGRPYAVYAVQDNSIILDGPVVSTPAYNLITTAGADFNFIMHPLTEASLTMAGAGIGDDIGACTTVNKWNVGTQSWSGTSYNTMFGIWAGDFATEISNPLMVLVTSDVVWPGGKGEYADADGQSVTPKDPSKAIYYGVTSDGATWYDFGGAPYANITGAAWIDQYPADIITTESGLIQYGQFGPSIGSYLYFDMSAFSNDWVDGDDVTIHAYNTATMEGGFAYITDLNTANLAAIWGGLGEPAPYDTPIAVNVDESGIDGNMPLETKLDQNYPNPFNPTTTINFSIAEAGNVKMNVYNFSGQLVNSLVNGQMSAGYHTVNFDASNLSAGVYYYTLEANNVTMSNKMILVK